ncbi:MAG: P-type conjugative transfer protein TrbG [Alphaproteobacteria bacterium]|nr:P-type conjugative transfer protein TrbG [Alphaproteobacteria bacterium]
MSIRKHILLSASVAVLLGGCAVTSGAAALPTPLVPATLQHDPAPATQAPVVQSGAVIGPRMHVQQVREVEPATARVEVANRVALREPTSAGYINAAQIYPFSDNALYRLYAAPGQVTDIALEPGETLSAISAGDTVRWAVGDTASGAGTARQVHVMVKPFTAGLTTNLVILTDKRTYHLELASTEHIAMAALSWSYPQEALIAARGSAEQGPPTIDSGLQVDDLKFRYAMSGDSPPWKPVRVFDDGRKVYIQFPDGIDRGEAPPLFVVGQDGQSELVNYRMRGNFYVVDRLFSKAELRLGQDPQQVVQIKRTEDQPHKSGLASLFGG